MHGRDRPSPHNRESSLGLPAMNFRPDLPTEPADSFDIRPIIQGAGKNATGLRLAPWLKVIQIDSVTDHLNAARVGELAKEVGLGLAYQGNGSGPGGQCAFQSPEPPGFQSIKPRAGRPAGGGIVQPFLAVHIN